MKYEAVIGEVGTKGAVGLASGTAIGTAFEFLNAYGVGLGVLLTCIFGFIGWYYKRKEDKRREREEERKEEQHQEWLKQVRSNSSLAHPENV